MWDKLKGFLAKSFSWREIFGFAPKWKALYSKHGRIIRYLIIGGLTTLLNQAIFAALHWAGMPVLSANTLTWCIAVAFAFAGNRRYVFRSEVKGARALSREAIRFFASRAVTLFIEQGMLFVMTAPLGWNANLAKLITNVVVIVLNYVLSRMVVFVGGKKEEK